MKINKNKKIALLKSAYKNIIRKNKQAKKDVHVLACHAEDIYTDYDNRLQSYKKRIAEIELLLKSAKSFNNDMRNRMAMKELKEKEALIQVDEMKKSLGMTP